MNPSRQWRILCQLAFLEDNPATLRQRIHDARLAIAARQGAEDISDIEAADITHAIEVLNRRESEMDAA